MQLQLEAPSLDFYVDVRLREFKGRWLAVAHIACEPEMGLGATARDALAAALSSLGTDAVDELLADPALCGISHTAANQVEGPLLPPTILPSRRETMGYSGLTAEDLARRVGRSGMRIRKLLRQLYPSLAPGSGSRWELTDEQVTTVMNYYAGATLTRTGARTSVAIEAGTPVGVREDVPTDWFWEGHVQDVMVAYFRGQGWTITAESDTANRAQGDDIAATRDGRRLIVEVKGYPSDKYRDPKRAAEVKRTNPTLQAQHWFSDALLKMVRLRGKRPGIALAMAFPDAQRYRSLLQETREPLERLGIGVYFDLSDGRVEEAIRAF